MFADVQRVRLSNGLTVLLKEDHRLPLACVFTWVNAGYFNEPDSLIGISHYIEHLFFKGTPSRGVGQIANETKALGGYLNASTIYDCTYYYTVVPSENVVQALDIQADALRHPLFDEGEMAREKEVILQELRRKYDNPDPYAWEKLLALAFEKHRIRRWRMGTEEDIRRYTRDDVKGYYERYYRPSNLVLAIVGDFQAEAVLAEAEKRYGEMPSGEVLREESEKEEAQREPKMARLLGDLSLPLVKVGFHAPSVLDPDYFAMDFLSILLGRGRSSRLYRSLKEEKRIVDGVGSHFFAAQDVGFFSVEMEVKPEQIAACEEEVWAELDRLFRDPPTADELERVRNIVEAGFFADKETVLGQAHALAYFESLGGHEKAEEFLERMHSVRGGDLNRVAEKYLRFDGMSLIEYVPTSVGEGAPVEQRLESLRKRVFSKIENAGPRAAPDDHPPRGRLPVWAEKPDPLRRGVEVIPLENGVTLLHLENPALPLVSAAVYFPGGRLDETEANCGLTQFMLSTSLKGTESRTADEIAFQTESLGTSIRTEATADHFGYSMSVLSRNLPAGLDLLADVILNPSFPEREVEIERAATLAHLKRLKDDNFRYPIELFYRALYGLHPYGLPRSGTEDSVTAFGREQLADWYGQAFSWRRMVVVTVGDVEKSRAVDLVRERFLVQRDSPEEPRAEIHPVLPDRGVRERVDERDRKQTAVAVGFKGVHVRDRRVYALEVLQNVLAGMGGRLHMELREKHALAYTVTALNIPLLRSGAFFVYMATSPEKEEEARSRLFAQLRQISSTSPTQEEMKIAKAYTRGSRAIALQGNSALAYAYLAYHLSGRGVEALHEFDQRVEEVTAEDVRRAASEIFDLERAAFGVVRGRAS